MQTSSKTKRKTKAPSPSSGMPMNPSQSICRALQAAPAVQGDRAWGMTP